MRAQPGQLGLEVLVSTVDQADPVDGRGALRGQRGDHQFGAEPAVTVDSRTAEQTAVEKAVSAERRRFQDDAEESEALAGLLQGEGGQALARGEGDMAIQAICEILPYKQIELVAPLPRELAAWIDMAGAVSVRAQHREGGIAFLKYLLSPESNSAWKAKGLARFQ